MYLRSPNQHNQEPSSLIHNQPPLQYRQNMNMTKYFNRTKSQTLPTARTYATHVDHRKERILQDNQIKSSARACRCLSPSPRNSVCDVDYPVCYQVYLGKSTPLSSYPCIRNPLATRFIICTCWKAHVAKFDQLHKDQLTTPCPICRSTFQRLVVRDLGLCV